MTIYRTDFEIGAGAERVWAILTDFERYGEWNPSLPSIRGELHPGSKVALTLGMPRRPSARVKARLVEVTPPRRLTWHGNVGGDRLFAGDREFSIEPLASDRVRFTHVEEVTGLLEPLFRTAMGGAIQAGHDQFNESLKRQAEGVESGASRSGPAGR